MLPTETDFDGCRVVRNIAEYTHLADHVALASTFHLGCLDSSGLWIL
jgi:hypothetical protein